MIKMKKSLMFYMVLFSGIIGVCFWCIVNAANSPLTGMTYKRAIMQYHCRFDPNKKALESCETYTMDKNIDISEYNKCLVENRKYYSTKVFSFNPDEHCKKMQASHSVSYEGCLNSLYKVYVVGGKCSHDIRITGKMSNNETCYVEYRDNNKSKLLVAGRPDCVYSIRQAYKQELQSRTDIITTSTDYPRISLKTAETNKYYCGLGHVEELPVCDIFLANQTKYKACLEENKAKIAKFKEDGCSRISKITTTNYKFNGCKAEFVRTYSSPYPVILGWSENGTCPEFMQYVNQYFGIYK